MKPKQITELASWLEWKTQCALAPCGNKTRQQLTGFAHLRFKRLLARAALHNGPEVLPAKDAWHLFESHLTITHTRNGKRYKDWLFARVQLSSDPPVRVLEGGASVVIRNVVREFLAMECSPHTVLSMHSPLASMSDGSVTLEETLACEGDPATAAALNEYESLAEHHAGLFFETMTEREKIALAAKWCRVSLASKPVEDAAGCKKSMINDTFSALAQKFRTELSAAYPDEHPQSLLVLATFMLRRLVKRILLWIQSEKRLESLFVLLAPDEDPGARRRV